MSMLSGHRLRAILFATTVALFPLTLGGCSDPVGEAEFQAARGELEQAEATLGDEGGKRARNLRKRIAELREERRTTKTEIEKYIALAADGEMRKAGDGLRRLSEKLKDAKTKEEVSRTRSQLSDLAAAEVVRRSQAANTIARGSTQLPDMPEEQGLEQQLELVKSMVERIVLHVGDSVEERDWARARSLVKMAIASSGEEAPRLNELLSSVEAKALAEMESLLAEAEQIENERGGEEAFDFLAAQANRFPEAGVLEKYHERMAEIGHGSSVSADTVVAVARPKKTPKPERAPTREPVRVNKPAPLREPAMPGSTPGSTPEASAEPDEGAAELLVRAAKFEEEDQLAAARDAWVEASEAFPRGRQRSQAARQAENLAARITLRQEVADAAETRADYFALLGVESINVEHFVVAGENIRWRDVEDELFERALLLTKLTDEARVGWIQELWVRGNEDAPHELAAALARGEVSEGQAWSILAHVRSEFAPDEGYAYEGGEWIDRGAARREALAAQLAGWEKKLASASAKKRDEHYATLVEQGADAREALESALTKRWKTAYGNLERGATLGQLEKLAALRELLDVRREEALNLIFDESEYFYPYNPPECPPDKARLYPAVQRRVDELVGRVREVWSDSKTVSLPKKFTAALEELEWNRSRQRELALSFEAPTELPPWLWAIGADTEELTLHTFAWNADEQAVHSYNERILAFNEHNWETYEADKGDDLSEADKLEQDQVRITNAYRMLFGRRALAWNSRIQVAAAGHSDWMSLTGKFSHFNDEDSTRTTPGDRMRLAGYNSGISENLHRGGSGPQGAHDGWARSSGHHRNLLMPGHREMASASSGQFWTQNFGTGRDFLEKLKAWYD